jgi:hypothetical protein
MKQVRNIVGLVFLAATFLTHQDSLTATQYCGWWDPHIYRCLFYDEPVTCAQWWGAYSGGQLCQPGGVMYLGCEDTEGGSDGELWCYYP